jgi:hypothetical protein
MRSTRPIPAALVLAGSLLTLASARPAAAQFIDVMSYWEGQVPNACTASSYTNPGTFIRQYREPTNQCPGYPVYHTVKGAGLLRPWAYESFIFAGGFLKIMDEISVDNATGAFTDYRAFRDTATGSKGVIFLKSPIRATGASWMIPPSVEEHWANAAGQPVCHNTHHLRVDTGSSVSGYGYRAGTWAGWLQDRRVNSQNPNVWHDVDAVAIVGSWGPTAQFPYGRFSETYTYGRWRDPATNTWRGIGLIRWQCVDHATGASCGSADNRYLVTCSAAVGCSTCPP